MKKVTCGVLVILFLLFFSNIPSQSGSFIMPPATQNPENESTEKKSLDSPDNPNTFDKSISPVVLWNRTYGGPDYDCAYSVVVDSDGGFVLAGCTYSFGAGGSDFWLVKTCFSGNLVWNKTYGGSKDDEARSLIRTTDGGFAVAGTTDSFGAGGYDVWLVRTDSSGNMVWNKTYGGTGDEEALSIVGTIDGGFALAGWTTTFGMGSGDFWLIKTDALGNMKWNKTYGGILWDFAYSVKQTFDGGFVLAGSTYSFGAGCSDFRLVKTDNLGNMQWNKTYGGSYEDYGFSVIQTFDSGYVVAGSTSSFGMGIYDFWLVKTDYLGNPVWNKTYGGTGYDEAWLVMKTASNELALVGWTESFGSGKSDCWLIITDDHGNPVWNQTWGEEGYDYSYSAIQTADGALALVGETNSFGAGSSDFLLVMIWGIEVTAGSKGSGSSRPLFK